MFKFNITKMSELTDSQLFVVVKDAARIDLDKDFNNLDFQNNEIKLFKDIFKSASVNNLELSNLDDYSLCMLVVLLNQVTTLDINNVFRQRASMHEEEDVLVISAATLNKRIRDLLLDRDNNLAVSNESRTKKLK